MGLILRQGPSGQVYEGASNGDVLAWDAAAGEWESSTLPPPPLAAALVTNVRWVDVATTVPLADQDGTLAAPFASMQNALDSVGAATSATLYAATGDYSAQTLVPPLTLDTLSIISLGYIPRNGREFGDAITSIPLVVLPVTDATAKACAVTLGGCTTSGIGPGGGLIVAGSVSAYGCNNVDVSGVNGYYFGCAVAGNLSMGNTYYDSCHFNGCTIETDGSRIEMVNTTFNPGAVADITFVDVTGDLVLDAYTCSQFFGAIESLNNGVLVVRNRPKQARISVVVPAVAADAVGYVNVSTVGTDLEGITTGQVVVANPTTDLVAAGAGGGFINARVSAADTIRCAFNGALAGGAADFVFAVLS